MPIIAETTDTQSAILRAFRAFPGGPPAELWPSPAILRRWLRRPGFRKAFQSIQQTLQTETEFHLAAAATAAARRLVCETEDSGAAIHAGNLVSIIRFARLSPPPALAEALDDEDCE